MTNRILLCFLSFLLLQTAQAQSFSISGKIIERSDTSGLVGVNVFLSPVSDSTQKNGTATDADGRFTIDNVAPGQYRLTATYVGFNRYERNITVTQNTDLGNIRMQTSSTTLQSVVVQGQALQVTQTGDTTQFNANAFKTNPDANAEDLLTKMPGVTSENGTLKVNGEDVQEVTVDGKPFFGDDPNAAIKNLPSEIIDKIQVFDKLSDQEQFTGFNSGNTRKAVNIVTKRGRNVGQFGKVFAGYGTDDRYTAGGNINFFNGARRISVIGMSNNINQQNFSSEDLFDVMGNQGGQNRGGGGPRGGGRGANGQGGSSGKGGFSGDGGGSFGGRSGGAGNFLVGQQGGITTTNSIGLNYSDEWGKKLKISGSYFFNNTNNDNNTQLTRQYVTAADSNLIYNETSATNAKNQNHRINARLEYAIDSNNSLLVTPRLSFQNNRTQSRLTGTSTFAENVINSQTNNNNTANNAGYNLSNNILFRHKFTKRGRTFSANIGTQVNSRDGNGSLYSLNQYIGSDTTLLDQRYDLTTRGYTLSASLNYTEPISKKSQLMANYSPSYTNNNSDKETFDRNPADGQYNLPDTLLSNKFDNTYTTHRGGISYRHNDSNYNFNIGLDGQYASLDGQQTFPHAFSIQRNFTNLLPNAMFMYKFSRTKNLRVMYRSSTNPPTITQLQNVIDVTNPLLLKTGNPTLKQDYDHNVILRYRATNTKTARSFFAFGMVQVTQNYIGNATFIPTSDTLLANGFTMNKGSQLNMPANLNGYLNARTFLTYGFPVKVIKTNLNLNGGFNYSHTPALINNETNFSNNFTITGGLTAGSNISENVDFTLTYSGNYNIVKNTLQTELDNTFYQQNTSLKFNWIFLKGFVFNTNLNHTLYTGLSQDFNQSFLLWNASFGYKFLKNRSLDARISVYDILNQNRSISRTVTETYIEDSFTQVLQRYFMLTLTYTLRNFRNNTADQ